LRERIPNTASENTLAGAMGPDGYTNDIFSAKQFN
jgi:hypothetical protein